MNITKSVIERNRNIKEQTNKEQQLKKSIGIEKYKRLIAIYPSINKNISNIDGHNILLTSRCILINYSVSEVKDLNSLLFNKTTYICELKFPGNITPEMLMANDISNILKEAVLEPIYAFNNPHFETIDSGKFVDYGLTMVDLNTPFDYGVINFSGKEKDDQYNRFYRDIVNPEFFNPKFYIPDEKNIYNGDSILKSGPLIDFIDNNTRVVKDVQNYQRNIKLYKNGIERNDRVINKRTMKTNELLLDIFSDLIFIPIEDLDIVIDSSYKTTINPKKFTTFVRFCDNANSFYLKKALESITKTINGFKNKMNGEKFYITLSKNEVLFSLNVAFYNKDNSVDEIRITNPVHKLYSQFALNNESIINSIENDANYAQAVYLESAYNSEDRKLIEGAIKTIKNCTNFIDQYKNELMLNHLDNKQMLEDYNRLMEGCDNLRIENKHNGK